jgi:putative DNA primase/helicase
MTPMKRDEDGTFAEALERGRGEGMTGIDAPGPEAVEVILPEIKPMTREEELARIDEIARQMEANEERRIYQASLDSVCKDYARTDLGNCDRFVRRFGRDICYCHPQRTWYIWDGTRWVKDESGRLFVLAKQNVRYIGEEAVLIDDDDKRADMLTWAATSQNQYRISGLISLSQSSVPILPEQLDAKKHLLNCQNGTLDLSTGIFRKHIREDLCSKITGVRYDPEASCPLWIDHLNLIFDGDASFIRDFQMMAGYSLLGDNPEQIFFILYGSGKNGKTVTVSTLAGVMGDYASNMAAESLMVRKNSEAPRSDIVKLVGARLITAAESDTSHRLSESLIKGLTGGDTITARTLYQTEREFKISGKIWLSTNHKPVIKGTDVAIWRRVWLLPFEVIIPEKKRDQNILRKLTAEGSGILNWMLDGLKRYHENGERLRMPEKVALATQAYRIDSYVIGQFINDRYILDISPDSVIARANLYEQYGCWCKEMGEDSYSPRTFAVRLQEKGIISKKVKGTRFWVGIREKTPDELQHDGQITLPEGGQGTLGDTYFQEVPYKKEEKESLGNSCQCAPHVPPTSSIPTTQVEALALHESVKGDPNLLSKEQQAAIRKFWPATGGNPI